ncbi:interleukin-7 receptor subunit alpha isoform X1 [Acipenser ruthenus]|uniref:interleukin-7 receptor subunit alpha isoform X1 n=2 Tax=Acipenser ruthenus TaxID=7906 RepID=UPI00145B0F29|nr:interleukin-7 receptor subunit alpha isoform X1 [Acipenser ruthenus]
MKPLILTILLMVQPSVFGQSGSGDDETMDEAIEPMECLSHLSRQLEQSLVCNFNRDISYNMTVQVCGEYVNFKGCMNMTMDDHDNRYVLNTKEFLAVEKYEIHTFTTSNRYISQVIDLRLIIKPMAPYNVNASYSEKHHASYITFDTPYSALPSKDYLTEKLVHSVAFRIQNNGQWEYQNITYQPLKIEGKYLKPDFTYEVKCRSIPNGDYFKGYWSDWSNVATFKTPAVHKNPDKSVLLYTLSPAILILLLIIFAIAFVRWKENIVLCLWPSIPNPKNTLEQMYKKQGRGHNASFNPETFGDHNIHMVNGMEEKVIGECLLFPSPADPPDTQERSQASLHLKNELPNVVVSQAQDQWLLSERCNEDGADPQATSDIEGCSPGITTSGSNPSNNEPARDSVCALNPQVGFQVGQATRRDEAYVTMSNFYKTQ